MTESATRSVGVGTVVDGRDVGWGRGDRLLCDQFAYGTTPRRSIAFISRGVEIVAVDSQGDGTIDLDALSRELDERARLVLVTHMSTHLGTITDATAVGQVVGPSPRSMPSTSPRHSGRCLST